MADTIEFFPIDVEQVSWDASQATLAGIRRQVFIEEQGVGEEDEFDGRDPDATHWIAWGANETALGTARLVGNKIGRMAVHKEYRRKGVGSSLLRAIIGHAIRQNIAELVLDAQLHAVGFYEDNGFVVTGDEFMDVGIAHMPMAMDLQRFIHRRPEPTPPDISDELRERIELEGIENCASAALNLVNHTDRQIRILSQQLDPQLYDNDAFCQALYNLAVNHPNARVMLLVKDTLWLGRHFHRLVETYQKLRSRFELRRLTDEVETPHEEFITGNESAVLYLQNPARYRGFLCLHSPIEVRRLNTDFDTLWNHSAPDPQVQRLHI